MTARHRDACPTYEAEACFADPTESLKLIAFYLPQFHPFPENDAWWGKGFTEWHNVVMGSPLYPGHDQPRRPADLGYYDLRVDSVFREQIALAKRHGIYGFCFHHYWFGGKRLMDMPAERLLADPSLDMPFCLNWANENWTRRWDGEEDDILIGQRHSPEDDIAFIADAARYMRDPRYIRVSGKPVLLVYRVQILPDAKATAQRWRQWCRENGIGEIHLVMVHSFVMRDDPALWGYDAAVEFPPHMPGLDAIRVQKQTIAEFSGHLYSYSGMADSFMNKPHPDFTLYKCVVPGWDNTARRRTNATVLTDFTPDAYADWLSRAVQYTKNTLPPDRRLLFINAWNEWAEGAYLEPDLRWGYACLNRTAECVSAADAARRPLKILVVSHDTNVAGAQVLLLSLLEWMRRQPTLEVYAAALTGGNIRERFEAQGPLLVLDEALSPGDSKRNADRVIFDFCAGPPDVVLANTVVTGKLHALAEMEGVPVVTFVHELEQSILRFAGEEVWQMARDRSCMLLAASPAVFANLERRGVPAERMRVTHAYIRAEVSEDLFLRVGPGSDTASRAAYRKSLNLPEEGVLVFGCGSLDWRKGPDLFFETAVELRRRGCDQFHFFWIGPPSEAGSDSMLEPYRQGEYSDAVTFLGLQKNPREFILAGDIFFLSSREDPFPLAALEGAECGLPVLCFADTGGMPELIEKQSMGRVVPAFSTAAAADACLDWLDESKRVSIGKKGRKQVLAEHTVHRAAPCILHAVREAIGLPPAVSVIVPNYNYARYLRQRLDTILAQTAQDMEIIILDDASTDESLSVIEEYTHIPFVRVVCNEHNSGNVFRQWRKGLELARAKTIWIAEADDACDPDFLEQLLPALSDPSIVMATCASRVIDENGVDHGFEYRDLPYMAMLSPTRWYADYTASGRDEVLHGMGSRNTIFNASSVLFRKPDLRLLDDSLKYSLCGDWLFYLNMLTTGGIAYISKTMNAHRRHERSVAAKVDADFTQLLSEFWQVHSWVIDHYDLPQAMYDQMETFMLTVILPMFPGKTVSDMRPYYDLVALQEKFRTTHEKGSKHE